jgi:cytochrome c553
MPQNAVRGLAVLAGWIMSAAAPPPGLADDLSVGAQRYAVCAACHGVDGMGQPDGFAPVIAAQHESVLLRQMRDYRDGTRWDPRMEHVVQLRSVSRPEDLAAVAAFVARMDASRPAVRGSGRNLDTGARAYFQQCAACHGATGQGSAARAVPRLAGQHAAYLQRQVLDAVEGRRPLLRATHGAMFSRLSADSLDGLTDYLALNARRGDGAPR